MGKNKKTDSMPEPDELAAPPENLDQLRGGFTTGAAAAAAALAAAGLLAGRSVPSRVTVRLPGGGDLTVPVAESSLVKADEASAVVIKDGGDDPDVTNHAEIGAIVRRLPQPGRIHIIGGRGVGRVTKPGLVLPPGQWAVNPVPRAMLHDALGPLLHPQTFPGAEVEIFVEKGETLALKTLNPRLGIVGGISILGTTGLVKPFSHEAYLATIESALNLARAAGLGEVVLTTGRQSEKLAQATRPDLPAEAFVQVADFFGDSLKMARERGFAVIGLANFFGKAVKQAAGHCNTHAHRHEQDTRLLAEWLSARDSGNAGLARRLGETLTARGALEVLREEGKLDLVDLVASRALASARDIIGPGPELWITLFDYNGYILADLKNGKL